MVGEVSAFKGFGRIGEEYGTVDGLRARLQNQAAKVRRTSESGGNLPATDTYTYIDADGNEIGRVMLRDTERQGIREATVQIGRTTYYSPNSGRIDTIEEGDITYTDTDGDGIVNNNEVHTKKSFNYGEENIIKGPNKFGCEA